MTEFSQQILFRDRLSHMARESGFDLAGFVPVPLRHAEAHEEYFKQWIEAGYAGEMEYLGRRDSQDQLLRGSLQTAFPWARSIVVCAVNYNAPAPLSIDPAPISAGWIARYAWPGKTDPETKTTSPTDYHDVLLGRLRNLEQRLHDWLGPMESRCYVDTGPIIERACAQAAGIGWTGKNTCILNQKLGSWLFLGVIVTSYVLEPERLNEVMALPPPDRCGTCRRCIEACPTDALIAPYEMDASRCISYLTIEKRGSIPESLRPAMGRQIFGCDICQDVCPWNRRAPANPGPDLTMRPELVNPDLNTLATLDRRSFNRMFKGSPVKRTKIDGLLRNIAIAMGNSGAPESLPQLEKWKENEDPVLSETADWAIRNITRKNATEPADN